MKLLQLLLEYDRDKTIATYGKKIEIANLNDNQRQSVETILSKIEDVDPSINKQYVQWICKQYISGVLKIEDLYKVTEPLIIFQQYKQRLPQEKRDINKLNVFDLYDIEKQITAPSLQNNQQNVEFSSDVKVWYNGPLGYLITPLTQEAAIKYSNGTKWCTGAKDKNNKFNAYNRRGPLFIWRDKNGQKYQFHSVGYDNNELMDASNNVISQQDYLKLKKHPVLKELLNEDGKIFNYQYEYIRQIDWEKVCGLDTQEFLDIDSDFYNVFNKILNNKQQLNEMVKNVFNDNSILLSEQLTVEYVHEIIDSCTGALFEIYSLIMNHYDFNTSLSEQLISYYKREIDKLTQFPYLQYLMRDILRLID